VGGGAIDLAHLASIGVSNWSLGDDGEYTIEGTSSGETITIGSGTVSVSSDAGTDTIKLTNKSIITDTIDGGADSDTLVITGGDVDLSGAEISNIETIKINVDSLSMTDVQWAALGDLIEVSGSGTPQYLLTLAAPGSFTLADDSNYFGVYGSSGADILVGNAQDNRLDGRAGDDDLRGGAGADRLFSGSGVDQLFGEAGDDTLTVTDKVLVEDTLSGGDGTDTLVVSDGQDLTGATIESIELLRGSGTVRLTQSQVLSIDDLGGLSIEMVVSGASTGYEVEKDITGLIRLTQLSDGTSWVLPEQIASVVFDDKSYLVETVYTGLGTSLVNSHTDRSQQNAAIVELGDGGYLVVWHSNNQDGDNWGVYGQRFDASGDEVGAEFLVNTYTTNSQWRPEASALSDGGFVIVWQSEDQDGSDIGIYAQRYDVNGVAVGDEIQVNTSIDNRQYRPSVTSLADGGFVVAWEGNGSQGNGIYLQRFDGDGETLGSETRVGNGGGQRPVLTTLSSGDFIVVWQNGDNNGWGIFGQRYTADGSLSGSQFQVNETVSSDQQHPR